MCLLEREEIDIIGFLSRTVALNDRFSCQDLFDSVDENNDDFVSNIGSSQSSQFSGSTNSISSDISNLSELSEPAVVTNPCNVCLSNPKSVLFTPCNHVTVCETCWDMILAEVKRKNDEMRNDWETYNTVPYVEMKPKCPSCNQFIESAVRNLYIYI